ncbi:MAG: hypothetical protein A2075_09610 [Geobacteraceae bacterium GWC2_58_44]|nr:MAG: hypothetical protein A2075_09610 [Geobacteraceae bacterium GWC2_58_44]HBG05683.1 hypothetical protein [Geobacter sp.]
MKKVLLATMFLVLSGAQMLHAGDSLSRAAIAGDLSAAQGCLKSGEKVNDIDKWGWTALHWSIYYGNTPVARWLLDTGADPNSRTVKDYGSYLVGTTPLILASAYGHDEIVAALLKKKADAGVVDRKGKKAIDYAREYDFHKCVSLLERK